MKRLCAVLALMLSVVAEGQWRLSEQLEQAESGDYLVTQQGKNYSVLIIRYRDDHQLVMEEVASSTGQRDWQCWIAQRAPGHTSWLAYGIDLKSGKVLHCYSYSRRGWLDSCQTDTFLSTLLNLEFAAVPTQQRRRIGPLPMAGPDRRRVWEPPLICQGERCPGIAFDAWRARWPRDGSELSGRQVTVYSPHESECCPAYFPYWIEVAGPVRDHRLRAVDAGTGLRSPQPWIGGLLVKE